MLSYGGDALSCDSPLPAEADEDHHEEVDDAVLVGVVVGVVDLRVRDVAPRRRRTCAVGPQALSMSAAADADERDDARAALSSP